MDHPRVQLNPKVLLKTAVIRHGQRVVGQSLRPLAVAVIAVTGIAILSAVGASPAHAIKSEDEFQITSRGLVATPFCEDNYLAGVARSYPVVAQGIDRAMLPVASVVAENGMRP